MGSNPFSKRRLPLHFTSRILARSGHPRWRSGSRSSRRASVRMLTQQAARGARDDPMPMPIQTRTRLLATSHPHSAHDRAVVSSQSEVATGPTRHFNWEKRPNGRLVSVGGRACPAAREDIRRGLVKWTAPPILDIHPFPNLCPRILNLTANANVFSTTDDRPARDFLHGRVCCFMGGTQVSPKSSPLANSETRFCS